MFTAIDSIAGQGFFGNLINLLIIGLFAFGWTKYLRQLRPTRDAFVRATKQLVEKKGRVGKEIFPKEQSHLNDLWADFLRARSGTTVRVGQDEISTVVPEDIFTEAAVLEGYNRSLAVTLAGVFTGLGILGTFIGLVLGMAGLNTSNPSQISSGASQLVDGMSVAFYTSITGIIFSLVWLLLDRIWMHDVQREVGRFFLKVRAYFPAESADRLLHRLLTVEQEEYDAIKQSNVILGTHTPLFQEQRSGIEELQTLGREQNALLQTLGTDLAIAFQNAVDRSFDTAMRPALEAIYNQLTHFSERIGASQAQSLEKMVEHFQDRLSEQLGGQFEGLARTLQETSDWHQQVHTGLDQLVNRLQDATAAQAAVLEQSTAACELFSSSVGQLGQMHGQLQSTTARLEETSEHILQRLSQVSAAVEGAGTTLQSCVEAIVAQSQALDGRIEVLDAELDTYRDANEQIRTHLATQIDALDEQVRGLTGFWLQYKDDLRSVSEDLRGGVAEFGTLTAEKLGEVFARFDAEMAQVVEHLSGTLHEIKEVTGDLPAGVAQLRKALVESAGSFTSATEEVGRLSEAVLSLNGLPAAVSALSPLSESVNQAALHVRDTGSALINLDQRLGLADERLVDIASVLARQTRKNGKVVELAPDLPVVGDGIQPDSGQ